MNHLIHSLQELTYDFLKLVFFRNYLKWYIFAIILKRVMTTSRLKKLSKSAKWLLFDRFDRNLTGKHS